ncbi:MAG: NOL1/NOP2/sun family putative RNA methylase [Candidatus Latescibacteria bacterium]|nr:NOL1/NOP2/sun family putative RNA methylase [Candidatus Latescibacterota bacterium]
MDNKETSELSRKEGGRHNDQLRLEALLAHQGRLLPDEAQRQAFRRTALYPPPACLRLNDLHGSTALLAPFLGARATAVPWCAQAYVVEDLDEPLGTSLEHLLGAFYIQAKATTLAVESLAPLPGEKILDMAASPGGKATQIAARMQNSGLLVVNEPQPKRHPALAGNLKRCGVSNAVLSRAPGTLMARFFHNYFDRILLDAPCSGDGIVRKNRAMLRYWSVDDARRLAQRQTGLLRAAFHMLRPGGTLVYSTCSLSTEENEDVVAGLLHKYPDQVEILPVEGIDRPPLPPDIAAVYPADFSRCARVWPHLHDTEGAFVATLRKRGTTSWNKWEGDAANWQPAPTAAVEVAIAQLEQRWQFALPRTPDQILVSQGRHLSLRPRLAQALQENYPYYGGSGLHMARLHKSHYYLSQAAAVAWGPHIGARRLQLEWPQVQCLFHHAALSLPRPTALRGEVLCAYGPWILCRGLVDGNGRNLKAMLPRELRQAKLSTLTGPPLFPAHKDCHAPIYQ